MEKLLELYNYVKLALNPFFVRAVLYVSLGSAADTELVNSYMTLILFGMGAAEILLGMKARADAAKPL